MVQICPVERAAMIIKAEVRTLCRPFAGYITDALGDARTYSEHANKPAIDMEDVKLAIQSRVNFSFTQPPPREVS